MRHKVSLIQPLPQSYEARIEQIDGVADATQATWFGGIYQDNRRTSSARSPVEPEEFLRMYPEFVLPPAQKEAWLKTRTGAIVGRTTAERFGWKVGDKIPLQATFWRAEERRRHLDVRPRRHLRRRETETDTTSFYFRHDYFDENALRGDRD